MDAPAPHDPEEEREDPSDVGPQPGAGPRREPPSYDAAKEGYTGISAGALGSLRGLHDARDFAEMIVDTIHEGLLVLDFDLRVRAANESFYRLFGVEPEETVGRLVYDLGDGQWDLPELRELLERILPHNGGFDDYEVEHDFEGVGRRVMLLNARRMNDHELVLLAIEDVTERRRSEEERAEAEATLRESEERFRLLVENAREYAIFSTDEAGRITTWSPSAERILGWSREEALGESAAMIFTAEDRAAGAPEREMTKAQAEGSALDERWHVRKDGGRFWASGAMVALQEKPGRGGALRGFTKILRDNTEQKEAEEALRQSEARFRSTFEIDTVGVIFWDADMRIREANGAFLQMTGFERGEVLGLSWQELTPEEHHPASERAVAELDARGETTPYEKEYYREDGSRWWGLFTARRLDAEEAVEFVLDITDRKVAEEELRTSEERLRRAQRAAHVGTWDVDLTTGAVAWSEGVFDLVGLPLEGGVPSTDTWASLLHPDDRERVLRQVKSVIETGGSYENEFRVVRPDGEVVWVAAKGHVTQDPAGRPVRLLGANYDVTARKRTEETLRELTETLEERVEERTRQVRRHEGRIRDLSRALALAEHEERRRIAHVLHDDLQQLLFGAQMAASGHERLRAILDEAIEVTRSLSHSLSPPFLEGEDVEDLLRWVAERQRKRLGLEVEVEVGGDVPVPDPALRVILYQIVRELLFNVVKHAGTDRARIVASRVDGHIRLLVEDEGAGFDLAELEEPSAVGLGLPSVRERVELVGGRLEVESELGAGTRVTVVVPVEVDGTRQ